MELHTLHLCAPVLHHILVATAAHLLERVLTTPCLKELVIEIERINWEDEVAAKDGDEGHASLSHMLQTRLRLGPSAFADRTGDMTGADNEAQQTLFGRSSGKGLQGTALQQAPNVVQYPDADLSWEVFWLWPVLVLPVIDHRESMNNLRQQSGSTQNLGSYLN
ncbi:hypothetical protein B0H13DRAFT_1923595 [Mycena leptocephala]|nr:hypothetical protein B0H13DRAFT_1923595 [Mycena leptocephala]